MRLTYKYENDNGYGSVKLKNLPLDPFVDKLSYLDNAWEEQRNKLGQLEDIEEELGIDLVTLIKALKNGCYVKPWKEIKYSYEIRTASDNINLFLLDENDNDYSLKDYGKTWALTKEELL